NASVAPGIVNSISPSADLRSDATSLATLMPFGPRPASSPASRPITAEPGASTAPASAKPLVAAMAWISVRPMRPPAPAITTRMSDMVRLRLSPWVAGIAARRQASNREPPHRDFRAFRNRYHPLELLHRAGV